MGHFCDSPESPNPLEINSIQKQQHCASTNFSSVHCLSFNHLQKVCQPIVPNIPSISKFPGRLQRFYQVLSMPLLKPSWLVKQPVILASHGIIAPPMTWSGLVSTREIYEGYVDDRTNQLEAESSANTKNTAMHDHASENVIMSLEHDATCPFLDHSQWQALSTNVISTLEITQIL